MSKVISYFKGDGHNWHKVETEVNVEQWFNTELMKLKMWNHEIECINDNMFYVHYRNKQNKKIENTLVYEKSI